MATPIPFILLAIDGKVEITEAQGRLANPYIAPRAAVTSGKATDAMAVRPSKDELDTKLKTLFRSLKKK